MNALPFDYARCAGIEGDSLCAQCLRHISPGRSEYQAFVAPAIVGDDCKNRIAPTPIDPTEGV